MDPCPQQAILSSLSQIEEILIARINPILQVMHAHGSQYKYTGHRICFPRDITKITSMLPHRVEQLDIIIVTRHSNDHCYYDFIVSRHSVITTF